MRLEERLHPAERDLAVELSVCRAHGRSLLGAAPAELVGEVPAEWVVTAGTASLLPVIPLAFTSSTFVPVATMPGWLQAWANSNPITHAVDATRALALGGPTSGPLLRVIGWILGLLAVIIPLAIQRYRRVTQ